MTVTTKQTSLEETSFGQTSLRDTISALRSGGAEAIFAAARAIAPELASRAAENDRLGVYPEESVALIWSTGLGALTIPREKGGLGASLTTTARAIEILAHADAAATLVVVWTLLFHRLIHVPDSPWPKHLIDRVTSDALAGPALSNFLNVEPDLGTSIRGGVVATNAKPVTLADGSPGWRINGHKIYSTGGKGLRWLVVSGSVGSKEAGDLQLGTFLVPGGVHGVEVIETWDQLGMRATASNDIVFHDVDVPFDHAIGLHPYTGQPTRVLGDDPTGSLASTALLIMSIYNGVAKASRDFLVKYLNERTPSNLGAPLSSLPRFQLAVGEIEAWIYDNDRLIFDFTKSFDERQRDPDSFRGRAPTWGESSLIKVLVSRNVIKSTELALSLVGNPGLSRHNPLERHYRDALCSRVHTPQDDFVLLEAGKVSLGLTSPSASTSKESTPTAPTAVVEEVVTNDEFDTLEEHARELGLEWRGRPVVTRQESRTTDGRISAVRWGDAPAESVVLHGRASTQSARSWDGVALAWNEPIVALDLPGHGSSDLRNDRRYTPRLIAPGVVKTIGDLAPTPPLLVGVSFGGLTSIAALARNPELARALVLVDILPWVAHLDAAADSTFEENASVETAPPIETFASLEEILDGLTAGAARSRTDLARNVAVNTTRGEDGRWAWKFDPGVKLALKDFDFPGLWNDLLDVPVPILLIRGGRSPVVSDEAVAALVEKRPDVTVATVAESGHEIHDEQPRRLAAIIEQFRASLG